MTLPSRCPFYCATAEAPLGLLILRRCRSTVHPPMPSTSCLTARTGRTGGWVCLTPHNLPPTEGFRDSIWWFGRQRGSGVRDFDSTQNSFGLVDRPRGGGVVDHSHFVPQFFFPRGEWCCRLSRAADCSTIGKEEDRRDKAPARSRAPMTGQAPGLRSMRSSPPTFSPPRSSIDLPGPVELRLTQPHGQHHNRRVRSGFVRGFFSVRFWGCPHRQKFCRRPCWS